MSVEDSLLNAIHVISDSFGDNFDPENFKEMVQLTKAYYKDRRLFRNLIANTNNRGRTHLVNTVRNGNLTWAKKVIELLDEIDAFTIESKQFMGKECYICYDPFEENQLVYKLPCGGQHIFHKECIDKWVNINSSCPYCRDKISIENITGFLNKCTGTGKSVLYYAIKLGNLPFVDNLIEKGAMVHYLNASPLHLAAGFNHKDLVTHFLAKGEDINIKDLLNQTPLCYASRWAGPEIIQYLLENGAEPYLSYCVEYEEGDGYNVDETILHVAVSQNIRHPESISYILDYFKSKNISIDSVNSNNKTPLQVAIQRDEFPAVKLLVRAGANLLKLDNTHPLYQSVVQQQSPRLDYEDELNGDDEDDFIAPPPTRSTNWKDRDIFRFLLKSTEEQFESKKEEFTQFLSELFEYCCKHRYENQIKILLKEYQFPISKKVFPDLVYENLLPFLKKYNIFDRLIEQPAFFLQCVRANNLEAVKEYIEKGYDIQVADEEGNRAANFLKSTKMYTLLNENKFNFHYTNLEGETPIHSFFGTNTFSSERTFILSYEKTIQDAIKKFQSSPIQENRVTNTIVYEDDDEELAPPILPPVRRVAVKKVVTKSKSYSNSISVLKNLLEQGIDVNMKTKNGITPLQLAIHSTPSGLVIMSLLLESGADINEKSQFISPLHMAMLANNKDLITFLIAKGADIDCLYDDETIIHYAVHQQDQKLLEALFERQLNLNIQNKRGETALWHAFLLQKIDPTEAIKNIFKFLEEKGATMNELEIAKLSEISIQEKNLEEQEESDDEMLEIEMESGADDDDTEVQVFLDSIRQTVDFSRGSIRVGRRNGRLQILSP